MQTAKPMRCFHLCLALLFLGIAPSGCGQLAPGTGQGYVEQIDEQWADLGREMMIQFYGVLRPSRFSLNVDRKYGENKYVNNSGVIPVGGAAAINGHDLCNRQQNPYCKGLTFGEELLAHPEVSASINDWLFHLCERVPKNAVDKTTLYYSLAERQRSITKLRGFMGCDGAPAHPRNVHIYVLRNLDDVFSGDSEHTNRMLRQSVIDERIIKLNQR